jgi:hypothetical protein
MQSRHSGPFFQGGCGRYVQRNSGSDTGREKRHKNQKSYDFENLRTRANPRSPRKSLQTHLRLGARKVTHRNIVINHVLQSTNPPRSRNRKGSAIRLAPVISKAVFGSHIHIKITRGTTKGFVEETTISESFA